MTAARLEELVELCDSALADTSFGFGAYFDSQDIADLSRCARAWAALERWVKENEQVVELYGYRGRELSWSFYPNSCTSTRFTGPTAIEAVEAAEGVK